LNKYRETETQKSTKEQYQWAT